MTELKAEGFGASLRRRREELGLSLDDVAASTRIRKTYLQALENENLQVLPGASYAIGFLRIYARQLELPVEPLLAALGDGEPAAAGFAGPASGHEARRHRQTGKRAKGRGRRTLLLLGILALLVVAAVLSWRMRAPGTGSTPASAPAQAPAAPVKPQAVAPPAPLLAEPASGGPAVAPKPTGTVAGSEQAEIERVDLAVLPPGGAVVRLMPTGAGVAKVSLDNQEVREYPLQPEEALRWKVARNLEVELSTPGLARLWVDQLEVPIAEFAAFTLRPAPPQPATPGSR